MIGDRRGVKFIGITLGAGEREDLRADDGGWAMDLAEMRQRELGGVRMRCICYRERERELTMKSISRHTLRTSRIKQPF